MIKSKIIYEIGVTPHGKSACGCKPVNLDGSFAKHGRRALPSKLTSKFAADSISMYDNILEATTKRTVLILGILGKLTETQERGIADDGRVSGLKGK
jgi:hypothetical protein